MNILNDVNSSPSAESLFPIVPLGLTQYFVTAIVVRWVADSLNKEPFFGGCIAEVFALGSVLPVMVYDTVRVQNQFEAMMMESVNEIIVFSVVKE